MSCCGAVIKVPYPGCKAGEKAKASAQRRMSRLVEQHECPEDPFDTLPRGKRA